MLRNFLTEVLFWAPRLSYVSIGARAFARIAV